MTIMHVNRHKFTSPVTNQPLVLRNGQIVQGEIVKIYPENKAEIRIGTYRLIAEINTSLIVGKKYFFQVNESENQMIQLRVIGDAFKQNIEQNLLQLLDKLGLKTNRHVIQFLRTLLAEKIPFTRQQLQQANNILNSMNDKQEALPILQEMFVKRLPINENVFQALYTLRTNELAPLLNQLSTDLQKLPSTDVQKQLLRLIEQILSRPQKNDFSTHFLQAETISKNELKTLLQSVAKNVFPNESTPFIRERVGQIVQFFFRSTDTFTVKQLNDYLLKLINQASNLKSTAKEIVNQFPSLQSGSMTNDEFVPLQRQIQTKIVPLLPEVIQKTFVEQLRQNSQTTQPTFTQFVQLLTNEQMYQLFEEAVKAFQQESNQLHTLMKTRFLSYVQQFIQSIGMLDEHHIKVNVERLLANRVDQPFQQTQTVKTLLMNLLQDGNSTVNEKIQPMIHFINGLQLQSVYESQNMIQAMLQLPGEKFALPKDLFFQFEGKKNEDGTLDADHCRILFMLQLQNISETVIDMFVQKRIVSLTVYNDYVNRLNNTRENLVQILEKKLNELNFQLSTIKWKPLVTEKTEDAKRNEPNIVVERTKERFDFRI